MLTQSPVPPTSLLLCIPAGALMLIAGTPAAASPPHAPQVHAQGVGPLWSLQASIPTDASERGMWDEPSFIENRYPPIGVCRDLYGPLRINPVHGALMHAAGRPDGKIVVFNNFQFQIYDPDTNQGPANRETTVDIRDFDDILQEPFCAGHTFLPNGRLLIAGGNWTDKIGFCPEVWIRAKTGWCSVFNASTNDFEKIGSMTGTEENPHVPGENNTARYYPTCIPLPDGSVLAVGGDFWAADTNGSSGVSGSETQAQTKWELLRPGSFPDWDSQPVADRIDADPDEILYYPNLQSLPVGLWWEGRHSNAGTEPSYLWEWPWETGPEHTHDRGESQRITANMVVLSLHPPDRATTVCLFGGGEDQANAFSTGPHATAESITYDPNAAGGLGGGAAWGSLPTMAEERRRPDSVLLPTGDVLILGGESDGPGGGTPHTASLTCELFRPDSPAAYEPMASLNLERKYHSQGILLADGRVWASGNLGEDPPGEDTGVTGNTYEIFYPPYLFDDSNELRTDRPEITEAPDEIRYGRPFIVKTDGDATTITQVALMRPCAVTHATDMAQRHLSLEFVALGPDSLAVTAPPDSLFASSTYYMLFVLQDDTVNLDNPTGKVPSKGRFLKLVPPEDTVANGETEFWAGTVRLTAGLDVLDGGSLEVRAGTRVYAASDVGTPVTIGIHGTVQVDGGTGADEVLFSSYETATGLDDTGTWGGFELALNGSTKLTYGYVGFVEPPARIEGAVIRNAEIGIKIQDWCAPELVGVRFESDPEDTIDILLDGTDTFIPVGYFDLANPDSLIIAPIRWELEPSTSVVSTTTCQNDWGWPSAGNSLDVPGKPDLIVQGSLITPPTPETPVEFRSTNGTPSGGDGWGGILFTDSSGGNALQHAEIRDAANLIRMLYLTESAGTEIRWCQLDHFQDEAIVIKSSRFVKVMFCNIERGASLSSQVGRGGIGIEESAPTISGNTIVGPREHGIKIVNSKSVCLSVPATPESLLVSANHIDGSTYSTLEGTGIDASWICTSNEAQISGNQVRQWKNAGVNMHQCANVKVACNSIVNCGAALKFARTDLSDQPPVRLRDNLLDGCESERHLIVTDNGKRLKLGPNWGDTGTNLLKIPTGNEWFAQQNDLVNDAAHELNALSCAWMIDGADVTAKANVLARIDPQSSSPRPEPVKVDDEPPTGSEWLNTCWPSPSGIVRGPESGAGPDPAVPAGSPTAQAIVPGLRITGANPARSSVALVLGVEPPGESVVITVYDIRGRRVVDLRRGALAPGMHPILWNGRDGSGRRVAPGAYFVRARRGGSVETRKVVLLD